MFAARPILSPCLSGTDKDWGSGSPFSSVPCLLFSSLSTNLAALFYTAMFSGYQQAVERDIGGASSCSFPASVCFAAGENRPLFS